MTTPGRQSRSAITIQRLGPRDAPLMRSIIWQDEGIRMPVAGLRRILKNHINYFLVAKVGGAAAGCLFAHRLDRDNRPEPHLFIYSVDVLPAWRRRGVGTALVQWVLDRCRREGIEAFVFTNQPNRAAIGLYEKCGMVAPNGDDLLLVYKPKTAPVKRKSNL